MLRSFQFNALSRGNQRPNLSYKKALRSIFGGFSLHQLSLETVTSLLLNIDISLTILLHFTSIYSETAVTTHHQLINQ